MIDGTGTGNSKKIKKNVFIPRRSSARMPQSTEGEAPRTRYVRSSQETRGIFAGSNQRLAQSLAQKSMTDKRSLSRSPPRARSPPRNTGSKGEVSPGRAPMNRMLYTASAEELVPQLIKKLSSKSHEVMSMKSMLDDSQRKVTELKTKLFSKSGAEKDMASPGTISTVTSFKHTLTGF